ncbi:MAG: CDP-glucose 4,6-dehydratase [Pseudobdellovibrionaceae bacterium]
MVSSAFNFWRGKRVFLTGHTGFKGAWMLMLLRKLGAEVKGYSLPAQADGLFESLKLHRDIEHREGDLRDFVKLKNEMKEFKADIVIHLAAQSLVLKSLRNPLETLETNVMGTANLCQAIRDLETPPKIFVNVTSDKCYLNQNQKRDFVETDALGGKDPYSASKACAELVGASFAQSFLSALRVSYVSVRAGNVIGPGDWADDRVVPDFFRSYGSKSILKIRQPQAIRPWQFVLEPLVGYLRAAEWAHGNLKQEISETAFNFGPMKSSQKTVQELLDQMNNILVAKGHSRVAVQYESSVFQEAQYLALDSTRANQLLGWKPKFDFSQTVKATVEGYLDLESHPSQDHCFQLIDQFIK